jgi:hypothetical protein
MGVLRQQQQLQRRQQQHNVMKAENINVLVVKCMINCGLNFSFNPTIIFSFKKNKKYIFNFAFVMKTPGDWSHWIIIWATSEKR